MEQRKQLITNAILAESELRKCEERLKELQKTGAALDKKRPGLEDAAERAEQEKLSAIDEFCENNADQQKVNETEEKARKAAQELKVAKELLETVVKKIHEAEKDVFFFRDRKAAAEKKVWDLLYDKMAADLRRRLAHEVVFLYAAQLKRTSPLSYNNFFETLFPEPGVRVLNHAIPDLDRLYKDLVAEEVKKL